MQLRARILTLVMAFFCSLPLCGTAFSSTRIGVVNFTNKTGDQSISMARFQQASDILAALLSEANGLEVLNRKQMGASASQSRAGEESDVRKVTELARAAQCQYMVVGSVTKIDKERGSKGLSSGLNVWLFGIHSKYEQTSIQKIMIDARVIDVSNGSIVLSVAKEGVGSYTEIVGRNGSASVSQGVDPSEAIWVQAVTTAGAQIVEQIREKFTGEAAMISSIEGKTITIDRGLKNGVASGDFFRAFVEGDEIYDLNGKSLGKEEIDLALLTITKTDSNSCTAEIVAGSISALRIGDRTELTSLYEADRLISRRSFPSLRPPNVPDTPKIASIKRSGLENVSTDPAKVIAAYGLPTGDANMLRLAHINANKLSDKKQAIVKYSEMFASYPGDYLAAFRAADIAYEMKDVAEARHWIEKSLSINPDYEPAIKLNEKLIQVR